MKSSMLSSCSNKGERMNNRLIGNKNSAVTKEDADYLVREPVRQEDGPGI